MSMLENVVVGNFIKAFFQIQDSFNRIAYNFKPLTTSISAPYDWDHQITIVFIHPYHHRL